MRDCSVDQDKGWNAGRRPLLEAPSRKVEVSQLDLLSGGSSTRAAEILQGQTWPTPEEFPVNRHRHHVRDVVWNDLITSTHPMLVAGFSSIGQLIDLTSAWSDQGHEGQVRLLLGVEPFNSTRVAFRSDRKEFTEEARRYWLEERGVSLRLSAKVLHLIELLEARKVDSRFVHGSTRLHAKIFVGDQAATVGSSNFTDNGLSSQFEANARFDVSKKKDQRRYFDLRSVAENYWAAGESWNEELRQLLEDLLKVVTWKEALARACSDLLTGAWAERYIKVISTSSQPLWPSQETGIAEALWIMESVGSVLVADATGSGKTRMGAHLVRAAHDRLWSTGRVRRDLTVLVGPPAVIETWEDESIKIGLSISPVSHGLLSRSGTTEGGREETAVRGAQILAVDEAHNFLNANSKRTRKVRDSLADNIMLFTATPISRGASDLLNLVGLLGPDNFEDETLDILNGLVSRRGSNGILSPDEVSTLRREIQRFTVRRTKSQINEMVDRDQSAFLDRTSGRISRYPIHHAEVYQTGETDQDSTVANRIREHVDGLVGIAQLERRIFVPKGLSRFYTDEQWLRFRLKSATGLARHHVLDALRSSRAALVEHLSGTSEAAGLYELDLRFKPADTGDVLSKIERLAEIGPPTADLTCEVDEWLRDPEMWDHVCRTEWSLYDAARREIDKVSDARERTKTALLRAQFDKHRLVLAFDHHPITLAFLESVLVNDGVARDEVIFATSNKGQKKKVMQRFALGGTGNAIAVCSDAMNEGLNLQRASCIVHLDLPTTLRVAEQRVGRIERMNSPHDRIESWWPEDGAAFATRAYEKLMRRAKESEDLLGSNLQLPEFERSADDRTILTATSQIKELEEVEPALWDGIRDALDPVRQLVAGEQALIDPATYAAVSGSRSRVMSRVSPVSSSKRWGFFAVAAIAHGAPRWILVDGAETLTDLNEIAERLRRLLIDDPPSRGLDLAAAQALDRLLERAASAERQLLPRRMLRALEQMAKVTATWAASARLHGDETRATEWLEVGQLASKDERRVDPFRVAECWLSLVAPVMDRFREENRSSRYILLRHIEPDLKREPLDYETVIGAFAHLPAAAPLDERVSACIIGVPEVTGIS